MALLELVEEEQRRGGWQLRGVLVNSLLVVVLLLVWDWEVAPGGRVCWFVAGSVGFLLVERFLIHLRLWWPLRFRFPVGVERGLRLWRRRVGADYSSRGFRLLSTYFARLYLVLEVLVLLAGWGGLSLPL